MTVRAKRVLLTLLSGSALAVAPLTFATVVVPATSNADEQSNDASQEEKPNDGGVTCQDGQVVDEQNGKCVALLDGISKQLQALPPPPSLAGLGGGGGGGLPSLGGIPSLGTINAPDLVLPSFGVDLVPDLSINPNLGLGGFAAGNALTRLPAPQLPKVNPLNPLGLPPPPDLTPGIPLI
ncbi:hypothetical protein [Mycolicibacterium lacusdiani]|uniref:hypothetical protein n=1 Tax=Mycolicibacterium lacusdiani TaxID=2895283 RepID=UPI001F44828B|nr:hypothetical protein [Mycolicibacterium lacusdiani]